MAAEATVSCMSSYFRGLNLVDRNRYLEKLKYGRGMKSLSDPYERETPGSYTKEELKAYKSLEAYKYVIRGHVDKIFMHEIGSNIPYCFLKAHVKPSQPVSGSFHQPWVCVEKQTGSIYCAHCTCMAGLGETCSHIAAVLFKLEMAVNIGLTSTCSTSEACNWNATFKDELKPLTIAEQPFLFQDNHNTIQEIHNPTGFYPLPSIGELKALKAICPDACFFGSIPKLDSEETDSASEDECDGVPAIKYGLDKEAFVRDSYVDEMELVHDNFNCRESGFYVSKTEPHLGASPNGIVNCSCCGKGILEIKCSYNKIRDRSVGEAAH
eukprot:gene7585-8425_t